MKWSDIKRPLSALNERELVRVISDLYKLSKTNRNFLDARFGSQDVAIDAYRKIVDECMYPDTRRGWSVQIARAQRAVSQYQKASRDQLGTTHLMVCCVELGIEFCRDHAYVEEALQESLLRMYTRAISEVQSLPESDWGAFRERLEAAAESAEYDPVFWEAVREIYDDGFDADQT